MADAKPDPVSAQRTPGTANARRRQLGWGGSFVYNLLYWPYLITSCVILFVPALVLYLLSAPFDDKRRVLHAYTCMWGGHYLARAPFASVSVERDAPPTTACIFVSNHQSMVDILAVFATNLSFLWVSKIENFYVPFLGWNMLLNRYIPLKRGYLPSIVRMVRTCLSRLKEGHNLFVFPEGTRSPDGNLLPFYAGAFRIAVRAQVPIVPVVLEGTASILKKHSLRICPGPVRVHVLSPMHPQDHENDWKKLRDAVRFRMIAERDTMRAEPSAISGVLATEAAGKTQNDASSMIQPNRAS